MRKLMFSLVATLAFGSFAMANNVELLPVEEVESVLEVETLEEKLFDKNDSFSVLQLWPFPPGFINNLINCSAASQEIYVANLPIYGHEGAQAISTGAFLGCMGALPGR